jgi:xylulokinase
MTEVVLAIDLGTGGPKVAVVDEHGQRWCGPTDPWSPRCCRPVAPNRTRKRCGGPWSASDEVMAAPGCAASEVVAVAVTSQFMSTVPVDADGLPVGPCICGWTPWAGR